MYRNSVTLRGILFAVLPVLLLFTAATARAGDALRVCADPGNMPLSNNKGEGFENKIAEVLGAALGGGVQYYYKPFVERGLTRTTLDADECDLMLDMPADAERVLTTVPLYRTTFVLVSRSDRNYGFKSLDDPRLQTLKVGVYQTSAIREALARHDVMSNTVIHYLSHDADLVPQDQPSYQVQQVADGSLDVAAVWGPFAGWFVSARHEPLTIAPANLMEDQVPLEFSMALAVRMRNSGLKDKVEQAMREQKDKIRAILTEYGVPLVKCADCLIDGDLPSHGPYAEPKPHPVTASASEVSIAQLDDWLKHGARVDDELNNAIIAGDQNRVSYLVEKKHANLEARDPQGYTPLLNAIRQGSPGLVKYLIGHRASVSHADRDGWTPLMTAAWLDDAESIELLAAQHADVRARNPAGLTPLGIASQYGKDVAAVALIRAGSDVNQRIGSGYTPLMLAVAGKADDSAKALIDHGADVNARNSGGITALMIAASTNQTGMTELLLKSGADTSVQDERGKTALAIARDKNAQAVVKLLEEAAPRTGSTSSSAASLRGHG